MIVLKSTYKQAKSRLNQLGESYRNLRFENMRLKMALEEIVKQETKSPNATVSRILAVAKDALGATDGGTQI